METMFLASGLGTRLRSVISGRPRPIALIEGCPFMEYVARELVRRRITDITFTMEYRGSMVEEHFGSGNRFGFHISYACEETSPGTMGTIKNVSRLITQGRLHVLGADTFYQIDYTQPSRITDIRNLDMALVPREVKGVSRYGQAVLDQEGILTAFNEKTEEARTGTINGGVYLMKREPLDRIPEGKASLEDDMISRWLDEGRRPGDFINDGYFIDIDIPEAYYQFQEDVRRKVI